MIQNFNSEKWQMNRREMAVYGGSSGSATDSTQFHIVFTYDSHHTKEEP